MRALPSTLATAAGFAGWLCLATSTTFAAGVTEELVAVGTHDGLTIEGLLSYPRGETGPFPGMLFIPGSGLHDADVTINEPTLEITRGTQHLFRTLARHFSRSGWAVLRYNKRGASFGHAQDRAEILESSTLDDLVEDARSALSALLGHPRVAATPLVIYAHSEGTAVAARLAQQQTEIDLLVMVGSVGGRFVDNLRYQLVDRNLDFFRRAADADGDGALTLGELDALDGKHGMGSVYVLNSADVLFRLTEAEDGSLQVLGFHPQTDANSDGRLDIASEIEPALDRDADELIRLVSNGAFGSYLRSLLEAESTESFIRRVRPRLLFVHGELDVQAPVDEVLGLMERLESHGRTDYDVMVLPRVGHSLSEPNDYFAGDGGLTVLDNLTLNAPAKKVRRRLLRRIEANLAN